MIWWIFIFGRSTGRSSRLSYDNLNLPGAIGNAKLRHHCLIEVNTRVENIYSSPEFSWFDAVDKPNYVFMELSPAN